MIAEMRVSITRGLVLVLCAGLSGCCRVGSQPPAATALDRYVSKPDPSYSWRVVKTLPGQGFTTYVLDMTSQSWRTAAEVDQPLWRHWLVVVKPDTVKSRKALLILGNGNNNDKMPTEIYPLGTRVVQAAGSVVAELRMVPSQPLTFVATDNKPRREDDLIAYTWDQYMQTADEEWPARMPMVKSAVRAMDCLEAFLGGAEGGHVAIDGFVVVGASKRGWTTWLTGVVDRRVVAIIPMVIDVLNVTESMHHHFAAYGFWAPALENYIEQKIMDRIDTPAFQSLMKLVDPYAYRHRLTMPKYIVNSPGDDLFVPDSSQFYFDKLSGEKYLRYVPNTNHSLDESDAEEGILAYYQAILTGRPRPRFSWTLTGDGSIEVQTVDKPTEVHLWQATNPAARDFRLATIGKAWKSSVLADQGGGLYIGKVSKPPKGWTAFFVELVFESGGASPLKFTTEVRVVPDTLPFRDKTPSPTKR